MEFIKNKNRIDVFDEVEVSDMVFGYLRNSIRRIGSITFDTKKKIYVWNQKILTFDLEAHDLNEIVKYLHFLNKKGVKHE